MQTVSSNKDIQKIVRQLVGEGWSTEWVGKHAKLYTPDRTCWITVSCSPSDRNAANQFKRQVRKLQKEKEI
jgi:hypothetical protein